MQPFTTLTGVAAPMRRDNVDTDAIIPSRETQSVTRDGYGEKLFANWRYRPGTREETRDFVLNMEPFRHAVVLVAGRNFGCGSSREAAVWSLVQFGIRCVVAPSFGEIFRSNCVRNGVLPAVVDHVLVDRLAASIEADPTHSTVTVDLLEKTILAPDGRRLDFAIAPFARDLLLAGKDELELTLDARPQILDFETHDRSARPWVHEIRITPERH